MVLCSLSCWKHSLFYSAMSTQQMLNQLKVLLGCYTEREGGKRWHSQPWALTNWQPSGTRTLCKACLPQARKRCTMGSFNPKALRMNWMMTMVLHTVYTIVNTLQDCNSDGASESGGKDPLFVLAKRKSMYRTLYIEAINQTAAIRNIYCNIPSHEFFIILHR